MPPSSTEKLESGSEDLLPGRESVDSPGSPRSHGDDGSVVATEVDPYYYVSVGDPQDAPRLNVMWNVVNVFACL